MGDPAGCSAWGGLHGVGLQGLLAVLLLLALPPAVGGEPDPPGFPPSLPPSKAVMGAALVLLPVSLFGAQAEVPIETNYCTVLRSSSR